MKIPYFIIIMFLCPLALVGQEINLLPEPWKVEKKRRSIYFVCIY